MSIAPLAGKYKAFLTSFYSNAPIIRGLYNEQCKIDLQAAYNNLKSLTATVTNHLSVIGS
jgi:hypothetical protein